MEKRLAKKEDLPQLKEIWKLCFGDEDKYIDFYFETRNWLNETAVLSVDGRIASMLTMIPVRHVAYSGETLPASMLYAIATHPDFRKRGFAEELIEYSNEYQMTQQVFLTLLVPAGADLFQFYGKRGYQDGFYVRESVISREEIDDLIALEAALTRQIRAAGLKTKSDESLNIQIIPIDRQEYNRIRRARLKGRPYLDYRDEEISYEKNLANMSGTDLYAISGNAVSSVTGAALSTVNKTGDDAGDDSIKGCTYAERISDEAVIIKELLIFEQYLPAALKQISELLPAEQYIVRTPVDSGEALGGEVRHFGMLRFNKKNDKISRESVSSIPVNDPDPPIQESYLGIAFD